MKVILVITRLVANRGSQQDDEFVYLWGQNCDENSAQLRFGNDNLLYLYHGCLQRFDTNWKVAHALLENEVQKVCNIIARQITIQNFRTPNILVLIHPPVGTDKKLIQALENGCLGIKPVKVVGTGHAGTNSVNDKVDEMARMVKQQNFDPENFEEWWKFFLNLNLASRAYAEVHAVLLTFFPLHIELQLENNQKQCLEAAKLLLQQKPNLNAIGKLIRDNEGSLRAVNKINENFERAKKKLGSLIEKVKKIKQNGGSCQNFEEFHRNYISLRDCLLKIVEAFEGVSE